VPSHSPRASWSSCSRSPISGKSAFRRWGKASGSCSALGSRLRNWLSVGPDEPLQCCRRLKIIVFSPSPTFSALTSSQRRLGNSVFLGVAASFFSIHTAPDLFAREVLAFLSPQRNPPRNLLIRKRPSFIADYLLILVSLAGDDDDVVGAGVVERELDRALT